MKNSGVDDRYLLAPCSELAQAYEDNRLIDDAIEQWNEVYARALNTKNQFAVINCNKALMGLYAKKGDMKNFLIAKDKYFTYSDSFMNQRSFLQVKNDWKHIEQPTSKTSKKNNYFWLWICVVAFMITPLWVI